MNAWSQAGLPFLFAIDFELSKTILYRLDEIDHDLLSYNFNGLSNCPSQCGSDLTYQVQAELIPKDQYSTAFKRAIEEINLGNSFLLNLTTKAKIDTNLSLKALFSAASAKYKLFVKDQFICFSPETFIKTIDGEILTYPMKGTIDASLPNADNLLLNDPKEAAEHATIVDLMRNDLSQVARNVSLAKFKFLDQIDSKNKSILQMSSEIRGKLKPHFAENLGDLMFSLLPAGSISGAPKAKTVEIISTVEQEKRGYYTGVCGIFDGKNIDSGVMIRFIEKNNGNLYYRTGGGITFQSKLNKEYQELSDKIYVPTNRNDQNFKRQSLQHQVSQPSL